MLATYQQQIANQQLQPDDQQQQVCAVMDELCAQLNRNPDQANSLYIYGPVGRGKSMLMDLFLSKLQRVKNIRLHYHHFMQRVHQQLNQLQGQENPMQALAADWANHYKVICLDEFMVEDIGDAMILANLWQALFSHNVILVTTSNTPPKELYRGGLARHRFEPFIELLEQQCDVIDIGFGVDFRRLHQQSFPFYQQHISQAQLLTIAEQQFGKMTDTDAISVLNRPLQPLWHNQVAIGFDFWQLCSGPRSHRDYMELANQYRAIVVANVPTFTAEPSSANTAQGIEDGYVREQKPEHPSHLDNEARRFIALVDECYDRGCLLLLSAEADVDKLYQAELLAFPFQRCASRLVEMQTWSLNH